MVKKITTEQTSKNIKIIFFGDIVGKAGRNAVITSLPEIKEKEKPDIVIANVENIAHGKGVTGNILKQMKNAGIDAFTAGEHIYDKGGEESHRQFFQDFPHLIKPINFEVQGPGKGSTILEGNFGRILLINIIGQVFMHNENSSPWEALRKVLDIYKDKDLNGIVVDFHAEATSEKVAFGRYFDGQISALFGTHTHVPTADAQILPKGTAYITDVGMNGPKNSVIGMKEEISFTRFLTNEKAIYDVAEGPEVCLNYSIVEIDPKNKKATKIKHEQQQVTI